MEYIILLLLSILGNLLTPTAKKILRWPLKPSNSRRLSLPKVTELEFITEEKKEEIRHCRLAEPSTDFFALSRSTAYPSQTCPANTYSWSACDIGTASSTENWRLRIMCISSMLASLQNRTGSAISGSRIESNHSSLFPTATNSTNIIHALSPLASRQKMLYRRARQRKSCADKCQNYLYPRTKKPIRLRPILQ